jgi:hypothetical protein
MLKIKRRYDLLLNFTHPLCPPLERGITGGVLYIINKKTYVVFMLYLTLGLGNEYREKSRKMISNI